MPNFWPGAVSAAAVPHPEEMKPEHVVAEHRKVRDQEVAEIAAYLWTSSEHAPLPAASTLKGDAAKGKQIFDSVGCRACHVVEKGATARRSEGSAERDYAPNLWNVADKARPEWILAWVKNPKALWPQTKMPGRYSLSSLRTVPRCQWRANREVPQCSTFWRRTSSFTSWAPQELHSSVRRSVRASSGAAVTNASPRSSQYTHA